MALAPPHGAGDRYGRAAIVLHWTIAALIAVQLVLAWRMGGGHTPRTFAVFQLHKSVGITILALSLVRLAWRLIHRPPPLPAGMPPWQRLAARATHAGFYLVMIGMPLSGWLMVSTSPLRLPTLLYGALPWPDLPGFAALSDAVRERWRAAGADVHATLAVLFCLLLCLHLAGALKPRAAGEAPELARTAPGGRIAPRLWLIAAGALAAVTLGALVVPPSMRQPLPARVVVAPRPSGPLPAQTDELPPRWRVEPGSQLTFAAAWGGQPIPGRFAHWRADIVFSPHALARSHLRVEIELASASTGNPQRDAVLPGADWLGAPARPQAIFAADRFEALGAGRFLAHGHLSLRGVTRPCDLAFTLALDGDRATVKGSTVIDRTAFGVGQGEWAHTDQIPAAVSVGFDLRARAEKSPDAVGAPASRSSLGHWIGPGHTGPGPRTDSRRRPR